MIIQCPKCGFSGRIPSYAIGTPHNAKCPRCQLRFELQDLLIETELSSRSSLGSLNGSHPASDSGGDPGASSYELRAIQEEFPGRGGAGFDSEDHAIWNEAMDEDGLYDEDPRITARTATNTLASKPRAAELAPPAGKSSGRPAAVTGQASEPWYARVLQVWGVVFLVWSALILLRSLTLLFNAEDRTRWQANAIPAVVSVLLLVPGAAGLFLLVDLGRFIRQRTASPDPLAKEARPLLQFTSLVQRYWKRLFPASRERS